MPLITDVTNRDNPQDTDMKLTNPLVTHGYYTLFFYCGLILSFASESFAQEQANWTVLNPKPIGGFFSDIHAFGDDKFIAISHDGDIVRTTDGGETFEVDFRVTESGMRTIQFIDDQTGWITTHDGTLLQSEDGGDSWGVLDYGQTGIRDVFFVDHEHGWGASHSRLYSTSDGGHTWTLMLFANGYNFQDLYFQDQNTGWTVGGDFSGQNFIFKTEDGGQSWTEQSLSSNDLRAVQFVNSETGWASGSGGGLFQTDDGGETWQQQDHGLGTVQWNALHFADEELGVVAGASGNILITTDGGNTWEATMGESGKSLSAVQISPDKSSAMAVGWTGAVEYATPSWKNWTEKSDNTGSHIHSVLFLNNKYGDNAFGWAAGRPFGNGPLTYTTDGGKTWENPLRGFNRTLHDLHFEDRKNGYAAGNRGTVLSTDDGGESWVQMNVDTNNDLKSIFFIPDYRNEFNAGWAAGNNGTILLNDFQRFDWFPVYTPVTENLNDIYFVDTFTGWAVGENGTILYKNSVNENWEIQESGTTQTLNSIYVNDFDKQTAWVVGDQGTVLHTINGGKNWNKLEPFTNRDLRAVDFNSLNTFGLITGAQVMFYKEGADSDWEPLNMPANVHFNSVQVISPNRAWIGGSSHNIHRFDGMGESTTTLTQVVKVDQAGLSFEDENTGLKVDIPEDALSALTEIEYGTFEIIPEGAGLSGPMIYMGPSGLTFSKAVEITLPYDPGNIPSGVSEEELVMLRYDQEEESWQELTSDIDINEKRITGLTTRLSGFAPGIMGEQVSIEPEIDNIPESIELAQNYPNPFNPTTVIRFQIPVISEVKLEVFDLLGRRIATLVEGIVKAGSHQVEFDASQLTGGMYIYRLTAGDQVQTRKMMVIK